MTRHVPAVDPKQALRHPSLLRDRRGGVSVEYLVMAVIGLTVAVALGAIGVAMVDGYGRSLQLLYADSP